MKKEEFAARCAALDKEAAAHGIAGTLNHRVIELERRILNLEHATKTEAPEPVVAAPAQPIKAPTPPPKPDATKKGHGK